MKKIIHLLYLLYLVPVFAVAQSGDRNYVRTLVYRDSTTTSNISKAIAAVTYYDGVGRPMQQVTGKMSNTGKDVITHIEYDGLGRQARNYMSYPSIAADLTYRDDAPVKVFEYYADSNLVQETTGNPYSESFFEPSPLSRVLKQSAPGDDWLGNPDPLNNNDHTVKLAYQTNEADEVKDLSVITSINPEDIYGNITLESALAVYQPGQLYKTISKNENWTTGLTNTTEEFTDKEGKLILTRTYNGITTYNTYYVYDQFGNLTYVLPPACNGSVSKIDGLGYQYKYDRKNRIAEKKLPGKQWEFVVYDPLDRAILTGPVISPFGGVAKDGQQGWTMMVYDAYGRVALTGWFPATVNSQKRSEQQTTTGAAVLTATRGNGSIGGVAVGYNNLSLPSGFRLLSVNYYDDYTWPGAPTLPAQVEGQNIRTKAKGLTTGSWSRVLVSSSGSENQVSYSLYDRRSRAVRNRIANYLGGYTQVDAKYDFDATALYTITKHKRISSSTEITVREDYTYDGRDRLKQRTHKINSAAAQTLAQYDYDELGQLTIKNVGSYSTIQGGLMVDQPMQTVNYRHNARGWLTDINDVGNLGSDLFAYKVAYNAPTDHTSGNLAIPALYNGGITETYWRTSSDNVLRKYSYKYDNLSRLTDAYYQKPGASVVLTGSYNERNIRYDLNGNITALTRYGAVDDPNTQVQIDNLSYSYYTDTNTLQMVADGSGSTQGFKDTGVTGNLEYTYDLNGNLTKDTNKNITGITYNHLNLPVEITFGNGNKVAYLYDAAGKKLKKTVTEGTSKVIFDYLSGYQYKGGVLQFFPTAEGYVDNATSGNYTFNYVYQYKDHLGNVRLNYGATKNKLTGETTVAIMEENHYYPFGLKHKNYNMNYLEYQEIEGDIVLYPAISNLAKYNYKYNSKELQEELGLQMNTMDFRQYDPALGRFAIMDPLAESSLVNSPYSFGFNNPVYFNDPTGLDPRISPAVYNIGTDLFNYSPVGATTWNNGNNGTWTTNARAGYYDSDTRDFTETENLPELHIQKDRYGGTRTREEYLNITISDHVYAYSKNYKYRRDAMATQQLDRLQDRLDYIGAVPGFGEPVDLINAAISLARGNYVAAGLSVAAVVPIVGWGATGLKQVHHIVPKAVYKSMKKELKPIMKLNGAENLVTLPVPFHGNHPQLNIFVKDQIEILKRGDNLNKASIEGLQNTLRGMIDDALEQYPTTGKNLNEYFRTQN